MVPKLLLTNDDGIDSPGLAAMAEVAAAVGAVTIVAPDRERSATSHGITVHQALQYREVSPNRYSVEGTPADCVILGSMRILADKPALVISGINRGANIGEDISYSGTVAAAFEAALQGIPGIAISAFPRQNPDFAAAARIAVRLAQRVLKDGLPPDVVLNVNFPEQWNGAVRLTRQGRRTPRQPLIDSQNLQNGHERFWLHEQLNGVNGYGKLGQMTDTDALALGYVSVSPLYLDRTAHTYIDRFAHWMAGF